MSTGTGWTIEEVERARDMHARGNSWTIVGQKLNRHPENCRKRVEMLNAGRYPDCWNGEPMRRGAGAPEAVANNDEAHVFACLSAGGFKSIALSWKEPRPFVWRAA